MKISKIIASALFLAALSSMAFAAKTKTKAASVKVPNKDILDYQGSEWGDACPKWVRTLNSNSTEAVGKELGIDTEKYLIYVAQGRGSDLDMAEIWVKNIQAKQEVAASISQIIASNTIAEMRAADGKEPDANTKKRIYENATRMASVVDLHSLDFVTQFWIYTGTLPAGKKKAKSDKDYTKLEYTYYVVYKMDKNDYQRQLDAAMKSVDSSGNVAYMPYIQKVAAAMVGQDLFAGNNISMEESGN
jgi:hypothetical protein